MNAIETPAVTQEFDYELHECTALWPRLSDEELDSLGGSILENGILVPLLTYRGLIIDGANRWIAGRNAGYRFKGDDFREWSGEGSMLGAVFSLNDRRRHLTRDQRAAIAAELKDAIAREIEEAKRKKCSNAGKQGGRGKKGFSDSDKTLSCPDLPRNSTREAALALDVSTDSVVRASKVKEASPEKFAEVKAGKSKLKDVAKELGLAPGRHKVPAKNGKHLIDVYVPEPEKETRMEDVEQEHAERAAIQDDATDEVWVETLAPYWQLPDRLRNDFAFWAIKARHFQPIRREFANRLGELLPRNRRTPRYFYDFVRALEGLPPEHWYLCPPMSDGGCNGAGTNGFDDDRCPKCGGAGYLSRS